MATIPEACLLLGCHHALCDQIAQEQEYRENVAEHAHYKDEVQCLNEDLAYMNKAEIIRCLIRNRTYVDNLDKGMQEHRESVATTSGVSSRLIKEQQYYVFKRNRYYL